MITVLPPAELLSLYSIEDRIVLYVNSSEVFVFFSCIAGGHFIFI